VNANALVIGGGAVDRASGIATAIGETITVAIGSGVIGATGDATAAVAVGAVTAAAVVIVAIGIGAALFLTIGIGGKAAVEAAAVAVAVAGAVDHRRVRRDRAADDKP
jgi:hypothetical protein